MEEGDQEGGVEDLPRPKRRTVMKISRSQRVLVPVTAIILALVLYSILVPKFSPVKHGIQSSLSPPSTESLPSPKETAVHPGHVADGSSIRLHPENHVRRPARTIELEWNITKDFRRPDGVAKQVYLINNQFPGPTIEARSGDDLIITVRSFLNNDEGVSVHWHGLHVSSEMDGVAGLTQTDIQGGQRFAYRLKIQDSQAGTFWYHSHSETQRADGLYGALVVHRPAISGNTEAGEYDYGRDQVLMIGDWYHRSATEILESYMDWKNFKIEPAPDSLLLNGLGFFDCSMAVPARPVDCKEVESPWLSLPADRTRLRIVNTGSLTGFSLSMVGYEMTLITTDGGNGVSEGEKFQTIGVLYPGERIDVIIEPLRTPSDTSSSISVALDRENMRFPNLALTATQQFTVSLDRQSPRSVHRRTSDAITPARKAEMDLTTISGPAILEGRLPTEPEARFVLYSTISYLAINSNRPKGYINNTSWCLPKKSQPLLALDREVWPTDPRPLIPTVQAGAWVEVVLNNMDDKGHPFHLHGHDFYVLAFHRPTRPGAYEAYNPFDLSKEPAGGPMNFETPAKKDTLYVPSMGYVVLRFKADNRGLWMFHCHVLWHQSVGMAMAFDVKPQMGKYD